MLRSPASRTGGGGLEEEDDDATSNPGAEEDDEEEDGYDGYSYLPPLGNEEEDEEGP